MTESENKKSPFTKLTIETLTAEKVPDYKDTPETRREAAHYLAGRLDAMVGEDQEPAIQGFYPEGTKIALSNNVILGGDADRAGYRSYDGLFNVTRKTIPGQGVSYEVAANHRVPGGRFERSLSMRLDDDGELADLSATRPERTGEMSQDGSLLDMGDIDDYIDGTNGSLYPLNRETEEMAYSRDGSRVRIVNKSKMRKIAKALKLTR